ncbi:hypothetical protein Pmani_026388 [Petrolisthes manimaculis]|uniref:Myb-like domain-containing protein n=1 Tax=Petrolisthes manimaculis TaxID=1843537 RepID=A0AAE1P5W6_9EUCA|nr:hypothetical protein Pmani_026388 [Petrolisthes manimaculis]
MSVTHDHQTTFGLQFDDPMWRRYECGRCHTIYISQDAASGCLARHLAHEEREEGTQTYSCERCKVSYSSSEEASQCLSRHAAQDALEQAEGCASVTREISSAKSAWTEETVAILIRAVRDAYPRLDGKKERRDRVWRDIFAVVSPDIPRVNVQQCKIKWKNLRYAFIKYIENMKTTGARKLHEPQGYELLCSFLGEWVIAAPVTASCGLAQLTPGMQKPDNAPVAGPSGITSVPSGVPVAGPSGITSVPSSLTSVAGPSGTHCVPSGVTCAAGPSGVPNTPPGSPSDPDDPAPVVSLPEVRKPAVKRKKIRPPSLSQRLERTQRQILEEVRASGRRMSSFIECYSDFMREHKKLMVEQLENQRQFINLEREKIEILKKKTESEKKKD